MRMFGLSKKRIVLLKNTSANVHFFFFFVPETRLKQSGNLRRYDIITLRDKVVVLEKIILKWHCWR